MNIIHVVPTIDNEASGPSYVVGSLNRALRAAGRNSVVATTGVEQGHGDWLATFPRRSFPYRLGRSAEMRRWLARQVSSGAVDVVHNHSLWMMPNVYPGWSTRGSSVPLVVSPHGTLSKWALSRSRALKRVFWASFQRRAIEHAALFHATAPSEYEDIRRRGFSQPVAIIPSGIDIPEPRARARPDGQRTLLFLGRIHPVKGVEMLLSAWASLQHLHPPWALKIVGPGDAGYVRKLRELAKELRLERVSFEGPLYGRAKEDAYRSADLFVLPTYSENFGVAIAESLAAGCPVVTTKGAPWSGLLEHRAGWWVGADEGVLRLALQEGMSKPPDELAAMGARGRAWMARDFSWETVAEQMIESYRWIIRGGARPEWIRHD